MYKWCMQWSASTATAALRSVGVVSEASACLWVDGLNNEQPDINTPDHSGTQREYPDTAERFCLSASVLLHLFCLPLPVSTSFLLISARM